MQPGSSSGGTAGAVIVAMAMVAVLVGIAAGALTTGAAIGLGVLGLAGLAALIFRRALRPARPTLAVAGDGPGVGLNPLDLNDGTQVAGSDDPQLSDSILRFPRILFYIGALTITQASWRVAAGLTISEIFFILAFGATVVAVLAGRPLARIPTALIVGALIFFLGGLISTFGATSKPGSLSQTFQGVYVMVIWVWTGATVLRTRKHLITALTLWTFSAALDGFAAVLQTAGIATLGGPLEGNRATGLTDHPNDLGGACSVALVPALMLATSRLPGGGLTNSDLARVFRWVILGLIAAAVVLSASVAGMLAGTIAVLIWLVSPAVRAPGRLAVVAAFVFVLMALTLAGGAVTSPTERIKEVTTDSGSSNTAGSGSIRIKTIKAAWPDIEANPIVGKGLDVTGDTVNIVSQGTLVPYQVHGSPVSIWRQGGIFTLLGVIIVVWAMLQGAWRSLSAGAEIDILVGISILAAFIAFLIYAMTAPFVLQQYGWFAGVLLVAWRLRRDAVTEVVVPSRSEPIPASQMVPRTATY